jgi:histidinol-phosphate aminotransferase
VLANLNRYPDRDAVALREALAKYISKSSGIDFNSQNIWAANGSNEILQTLMLACGGRGALGFIPSYSVHPLIAKATGTPWISGERETSFNLDMKRAVTMIRLIIQPERLLLILILRTWHGLAVESVAC